MVGELEAPILETVRHLGQPRVKGIGAASRRYSVNRRASTSASREGERCSTFLSLPLVGGGQPGVRCLSSVAGLAPPRAHVCEHASIHRRNGPSSSSCPADIGYAGGYGAGVARSICAAYLPSIAARIWRGFMPLSRIAITSRVTPKHTSQVGAIESSTAVPSGLTAFT